MCHRGWKFTIITILQTNLEKDFYYVSNLLYHFYVPYDLYVPVVFSKKKPNFLYMYFLLIVCLMYCSFALVCVYGMLHSLSCSFTSTSLLTKQFCHNNIQHRTDSAWKMEWQFMPVHADDLLKGHTKKRGLEITPGVLEYCLNNFCRNYNGIWC